MNKWIGIVALSAMASFSCAAKWQVMEQDSRVSFISVKKGDIGEVPVSYTHLTLPTKRIV